ncbi:TPA: IS21 family transposase [Legionella pneumophila subsp. pneumophila]|nr:IS21 family transposase [Legionella pneumophila]HAT9210822.1 IS21 family transposase [Legionella pneumophila subsp. pneumophila]
MSISDELQANILRYYHVEQWRVGTISSQLGVHHSTIKRVLSETGVPKKKILVQPSMMDPYLPFVLDTLQRYPTLTASRLFAMVQERGYPGGIDHFRHLISCYRPKPAAEAYLRLRTLPGEQAQVDWGHFGTITIGQAKRPLMAFVMVLSYSRAIYLHFYLNQRTENFLRGHEQAFQAFGGVPRVLLYDNLKSAVLERQGDAIRFNPTLLAFAAHYRFEPRPCAVYRGNEKGRVERAIRYVRDNFFAARTYNDLDDLNAQAMHWCSTQAANRPCPEDKTKLVDDAYQEEQSRLVACPDNPFPVDETECVHIGKTPYARFDMNDYSVPHEQVRKTLTIQATLDTVTILDGATVLAKHPRSYDKAKQIECAEHVEQLIERKKGARLHRGQSRLTHAIDCARDFLNAAAVHGYSLGSTTNNLLSLLDDYGATELAEAMADALARGVPHANAVLLSLQRRQDEREQPPLVVLPVSNDKRINELIVKPHKLSDYDVLNQPELMEEH